jgi:hypothetical protein
MTQKQKQSVIVNLNLDKAKKKRKRRKAKRGGGGGLRPSQGGGGPMFPYYGFPPQQQSVQPSLNNITDYLKMKEGQDNGRHVNIMAAMRAIQRDEGIQGTAVQTERQDKPPPAEEGAEEEEGGAEVLKKERGRSGERGEPREQKFNKDGTPRKKGKKRSDSGSSRGSTAGDSKAAGAAGYKLVAVPLDTIPEKQAEAEATATSGGIMVR